MSDAMRRDPDVTRDAQRPRSPGGDEIMNAGPRYGKAGHTDPRKSEENPDAKRRDQRDDLANYMEGLNGKGEEPLTARVEPHGEIAVAPWDDPADVVEAFGASKADEGTYLDADTMTKLMEAFCARRPCSRLSVKAPWLPTRSDPGEAVG